VTETAAITAIAAPTDVHPAIVPASLLFGIVLDAEERVITGARTVWSA
jgi:hypothetical protein